MCEMRCLSYHKYRYNKICPKTERERDDFYGHLQDYCPSNHDIYFIFAEEGKIDLTTILKVIGDVSYK